MLWVDYRSGGLSERPLQKSTQQTLWLGLVCGTGEKRLDSVLLVDTEIETEGWESGSLSFGVLTVRGNQEYLGAWRWTVYRAAEAGGQLSEDLGHRKSQGWAHSASEGFFSRWSG